VVSGEQGGGMFVKGTVYTPHCLWILQIQNWIWSACESL